jgi:hypothetical protein
MSYVFSGKLDVSKGVNPNFNFNFEKQKSDEAAKKAADVILKMELSEFTVLGAVLKCGEREVKRYPRIEKQSCILVSI